MLTKGIKSAKQGGHSLDGSSSSHCCKGLCSGIFNWIGRKSHKPLFYSVLIIKLDMVPGDHPNTCRIYCYCSIFVISYLHMKQLFNILLTSRDLFHSFYWPLAKVMSMQNLINSATGISQVNLWDALPRMLIHKYKHTSVQQGVDRTVQNSNPEGSCNSEKYTCEDSVKNIVSSPLSITVISRLLCLLCRWVAGELLDHAEN